MEDLGSLDDMPSQLGDMLIEAPSQGSTIDSMLEDPQSSMQTNSQVFGFQFLTRSFFCLIHRLKTSEKIYQC